MESQNPKFALYGATYECARTNMLLLLLSEVSTEANSFQPKALVSQYEYKKSDRQGSLKVGCTKGFPEKDAQ